MPEQIGTDPETGYPIFNGGTTVVMGHRPGGASLPGLASAPSDIASITAPTPYNATFSDVPGMAAQQAQESWDWAKNNPGAVAGAAISAMPGVGLAGRLGAAVLGSLYDQYSQDLTPTEQAAGVASAALGAIPGGKVETLLGDMPIISAEKLGGIPGYAMLDYSRLPGARRLQDELYQAGIPRLVPSSSVGNAGLGSALVGNPEYMMHPETYEGQLFQAALNRRAAINPDLVYSGVSEGGGSRALPQAVTPMYREPPEGDFGYFPVPGEKGLYTTPKWTSTNLLTAGSYAYPPDALDLLATKIQAGKITDEDLAPLGTNTKDLMDRLRDRSTPVMDRSDIASDYLTGLRDPEFAPKIQQFVPFFENPRVIDKQFHAWHEAVPSELEYPLRRRMSDRDYQALQLDNARQAGNDALLYQNQYDAGGAWTVRNQLGTQAKATIAPADILVGLDPSKLKYPYNYGLWNIHDYRPLAAVPAAATGLGAALYAQQKGAQ